MASTLQSVRSAESWGARRDGSTTSSQNRGLDWGQIAAGIQENWESIEEEVRQAQPPAKPTTEEEPVRQQATELQRREDRKKTEEEPKSPVAVETVASTSPLVGESVAQQALNFRAPELPRAEGQVPFVAVPNHSAGASGFGNTWAHAAKLDQGPTSIVMAE